MTETIRQSLRDSKAARWAALGIISITMFAGYYLTDVMSPLKPMLESEFGWSSTTYGWFTSSYGWLNVFFLMLIFGGIILDKMGVRFTGLMASGIMVVGAAIKYWAISTPTLVTDTTLGIHTQVFYASVGFAIFAVGVEIAGITVSKIIVKWFKGHEMAFAMGMQMAVARLGTMLALMAPVPLAMYFSNVHTVVEKGQLVEKMAPSISAPIAFALLLLVIGFIAFFIYMSMDKKLELSETDTNIEEPKSSTMKELWSGIYSDLRLIVGNKGFWLIATLCVLFYSSVFPFIKYAADLMVNKYGLDQEIAGRIPGLLPFGTILLTPLFGGIYDKKGKGVTIMIIGAVLILFVHSIFSLPILNYWQVAVVLTIILGIALSLVPSAMWPSVPKIIPEKQLGTAFSLIFWIQNWGLMGIPLLIGVVLDKSNPQVAIAKAAGTEIPLYDYTNPMLIFAGLGALAIIVGLLLKREDRIKGYGLQLPNIQK
ncbi:nitrate/nitrite transporter [Ancylomarina sp. 16SWW S1-10-2]|uniref:MFS transporter n=1 Tax=Ancylomarina sp. 16SWW S1-10-2 TaxID=2499681 RepID=UPI0012AD9714|nr:MFS transporter [Ancylomarina sp. 16SWW S1-10-2]MRT93731.1 MFS transporter [Ancylomarina sp. 16SWW S1-10-2]